MQDKRGQVSVEFMALVSALLLGIVLLGYNQLNDTRSGIDTATAQDAVDSIARAADKVYAMGPCSRTYVYVTIPKSVSDNTGYQGKNLVWIKINQGNGEADVISPTKAQIQGYIRPYDRGYKMPVFQTCSGVIQVGQDLDADLTEVREEIAAGGFYETTLSVKNNRDISVEAMEYNTKGTVGSWTTLTGLASSISTGSTDTSTLRIDVPADADAGTYSGWVIVNGTAAIFEIHEIVEVS